MYHFGDCELNIAGRELRRAGHLVHLEPQAFDLLVCLVERRHEMVSKADLLDGVWGHPFLSEANLTTRVKEVRRAVGDSGTTQHTIRNERGRGYRFVAVLTEPGRAPAPRADRSVSQPWPIGRLDEIQATTSLVREHGLVTLVGPGGVGKSTLARAVAAADHDRFEDGTHFVELAGLTETDDLLAVLARHLDIVTELDRPASTLTRIALLDALIVLDNCEHLVDRTAHLVDVLVRAPGQRVRLLATSRVRLGVSTEHVLIVEPLAVDDAVEMFRRRADACGRPLPVEVSTQRIADLVESVDRLPLIIEMAAARLGSMSFDELAAAMKDGGSELVHVTHRTPAVRHRSAESLIAWSAEQLTPDERADFIAFGAFAGAVTAADAMAVIRPGEQLGASTALWVLADHSLLSADVNEGRTTYRMLATVRAVARRWLAHSDQNENIHRRHAEHARAVVRDIDDEIRGEREGSARARLDEVVAETRAAVRWASRHEPRLASEMIGSLHLPAYSALWNEPAAWSQSLLDSTIDQAGSMHGAHLAVAAAAANRGDLTTARIEATLAAAAPDGRVRASVLEVLADVALYSADLPLVLEICDELDSLGRESGDVHARAIAATGVTCAHSYAARPADALSCVRAVDLTGMSPSDRAWLAYAEGEALAAGGNPEAMTHYLAAFELATSVGNRFISSVASLSIATGHAGRGDHARAFDAYSDCLSGFERHGNLVHAVTTLRNLAELLAVAGDARTATLLAGATSSDTLRPSYGAEAARLPDALAAVSRQVGDEQFGLWFEEGGSLGLDGAVRLASAHLRHDAR